MLGHVSISLRAKKQLLTSRSSAENTEVLQMPREVFGLKASVQLNFSVSNAIPIYYDIRAQSI